jgi:hypothetical protein
MNYPQICPACLKERGYCLLVWDMAAYCVCPTHQLLLIDKCPHCRHAMSWSRPAIDVCVCGRYLTDSKGYVEVDQLEVMRWCALAQSRLRRHLDADTDITWRDSSLAGLNAMSDDGLCRLAWAFGIRQCRYQGQAKDVPARMASPNLWCDVLSSAHERWAIFCQGNKGARSLLFEGVYVPGLEGLAAKGLTVEDRTIAAQILEAMNCHDHAGGRGGRLPRGQLSLFSAEP